MSYAQVRVTFQPIDRAVFVLPGTSILEAAGRAGLSIDTPCGGSGTCGKCRIQIMAGAGQPVQAEREVFSEAELNDGWRLACQTVIRQEEIIRVPESSLFADQHQILEESKTQKEGKILPAIRK
ncbi:unnamed protein product, partial [marine sediment metagenome]